MTFLGVDTSVTGRRWLGLSPEEDRAAEAIRQATALPFAVTNVLARRGVSPEAAPGFLAPTLRDLMPDPMVLRDMEPAATRFLQAVKQRQRIAVFADYDVDGGSSAALLLCWLREMGLQATLYIPDRIDEGYGPNVPAMQALGAKHDLIICVDCGTLSHEPIAAAGCDVIVLDHHLGGETLPDCVAVVNPNRQDETGDLSQLCAAGVVFMMLVDANRRLRAEGVKGPDLMGYLDLVALATVADVAPLTGVNRALVRTGLSVMAKRGRPGLAALADVSRLTHAPNSHTLGFLFGPRVNAGGRIGQADLGARLLATDNPAEAALIAARLEELNVERRAIEAAVRAEAIAQAEARGVDGPLVWAAGDGWHPGVVGIAAARLKEAYNRPSVVIGIENGIGKGSARSVTGVDLGAAIHRVAAEGLLEKGGGHKMAAGLTVRVEKLDAAMARLADLLARQGAGEGGPADLQIDGMLEPEGATPELIAQIEAAGPFGASAPAPRFAFASQRVSDVRQIGSGHLKITFGSGATKLTGMAFGAWEGPLGQALQAGVGERFHLAGRVEVDTWGGRQRVQLRLEDAAKA
ncbi:single-stranded-DNA-specific exonuclease RecJ [Falsigemmobacter intermedius]|uniref:Single-stranded-DNA-specific exonuclease RecJ n=1 Tax=Falsigemmobacter intermedius TaxID=1553448 RepID=A0A3S3YRP8_9RHOB|nr:single-stranded-DNA-specific exonuclease RecJ [Falsigemmobacter intermedius]RWY44762.1 single-stranded-DNA-specific exonuclease RecJ [Falsigemmobacter intermedius]